MKQKIIALFLFLGLGWSGCVNTEVMDEPAPGTDKVQVKFQVELPDVTTPATRGIQTETEASVSNFYVLLFDSADKFVDKKIVPASSFTSETSGAGSTAKEIKAFTTALIKSANAADTYNIVLLANIPASGALKTAVDAIAVGADRATVLTALTQTYAGNPTMPVPMASIPKTAVQISEGMSALSFDMIRMVARIDVELATAVATSYSVKQVLFYNYNTIGRVWTNNYSGTTTTGIATLSNRGTAAAGSSYAVANTRSGGLALTNFEALMYAQEATVSAVANRPCIVIELEDKSGVSQGFYRADFWSNTGTPQYLDILRNHRYQFTVTEVNGTGFSTPDDAYNSTPAGITTEVISIDESEIKEIVVSGNYWLGLSSTNVELSQAAQTDNSILAKTNVTAGWSVEGIYNDAACSMAHNSAWLTSATKSGNNLTVTVIQNPSLGSRAAYVKLTAGTLENVVRVVQKAKPQYIIGIDFLELTLDSHFDYRPLKINFGSAGLYTKVEILNTDGTAISGTPWLVFSSHDNYTDAYNATPTRDLLTSNTYDTSSGTLQLHLYADEYVTIGGADRKYLVRISSSSTIAGVDDPLDRDSFGYEVSQKSINVMGQFGGTFNPANIMPYEKQLGIEHLEEYYFKLSSSGPSVSGIQWGFHGVTTGVTDIHYGHPGTITLAENLSGWATGITPPYTDTNTYAARYCYDKNRDLNGNGVLDTNEIVWYLPAHNQLVALGVAENAAVTPFAKMSYANTLETTANNAMSVYIQNGPTSSSYIKTRTNRVRCVRDL